MKNGSPVISETMNSAIPGTRAVFPKMISLIAFLYFGFPFLWYTKNIYQLQKQNSKNICSEITVSRIGADNSKLNISGSLK